MCGSDSRIEEISANADSVQRKRVETCATPLKMVRNSIFSNFPLYYQNIPDIHCASINVINTFCTHAVPHHYDCVLDIKRSEFRPHLHKSVFSKNKHIKQDDCWIILKIIQTAFNQPADN